MLRIAICDDTEQHSEQLMKYLRTFAAELTVAVEIECFASLTLLGKALEGDANAYRLLVLETAVGGADGIAFARMLRSKGCDAEILYLTECADRALDAYSTFPVGFLQKPMARGELRNVFAFVARRYEKKPSIILNGGDGKRHGFVIDDIIYIEVFRTELEVHCRKGGVTCAGALNDVFEKLPKPQFYRSHRSFIVNLLKVRSMEKYRFVMESGDFVTIAKNRYAEAKKAWKDFCGLRS
ncbi:MAG: response regulator transcription factor [Clostridia bacterium]|nr:response regulator transcription factor [Clostridia bacterium]